MELSELVDKAIDIEIENMTKHILSLASNFSTKDLYGYQRKVQREAYYKVLTECMALISVFCLEEFSADHFNMAAAKYNQPRLVAAVPRSTRDDISDDTEDEAGRDAQDVEASEGVALLVRVVSLVTNVIISFVLAVGSITALNNTTYGFNKQYTPVILGTVALVVSAVTVISWYSTELSYLRQESFSRRLSRGSGDVGS